MTSTDYYIRTWGEGLCRCGCGQPLASARRRFISGHDSKLLAILLDAQREGALIRVQSADSSVPPLNKAPDDYAEQAFFPQGLRWFRVLAGLSAPAYDELPGVEDPDLSHLDLGAPGLEDDLQTVRDIVARASESWVDVERVDRLQEEIGVLRQQLADATRPITLTRSDLVNASDREVTALARRQAEQAAGVLQRARYEGDANDMWDIITLFRSTDPVIVRAARAFLGQEIE